MMIPLQHSLALMLALALLIAVGGCEKPPPEPPVGVDDTASLFSPIQRERIEKTLERLLDQHQLYVEIRTDFGAPLAERPSLDFPGKEVMSIELYPTPQVAEIRFHSYGGVLKDFATYWENRLRELAAPTWRTPGRTGDAVELWLGELAAHFGTEAAGLSLMPDESQMPVERPEIAPMLSTAPDEHFERHDAPPGWYKSTDPALPQPSANVAYAAFLELARRGNTRGDLQLYTKQSQENFVNFPMSTEQLATIVKKYSETPYELVESEGRAVVHFPRGDGTYVPFFFQNSEDGWRLDFFSSARAIGISVERKWFLKTREHPYMFAFQRYWVDERGYVIYGAGRR